jgi:hypothetical protein
MTWREDLTRVRYGYLVPVRRPAIKSATRFAFVVSETEYHRQDRAQLTRTFR